MPHHGSECKDFDKSLDLKGHHPQPAIIPTGRLASIPSISPSPEHSEQNDHFFDAQQEVDNLQFSIDDADEIVNTGFFQIPLPVGDPGLMMTFESLAHQDILNDIVEDPFQYCSLNA